MQKTFHLFRFNIRCRGKCRSLASTASLCAHGQNSERTIPEEKIKLLEFEKRKYENTFGDFESFARKFDIVPDDPEDIAEYEKERRAKGKSLFTYKNEIKSLLEKHHYEEAKRILVEDMTDDKIKPNIGVYRMFLNYTAQKGDLEEAYKLFIRYKERQGKVTGPMYTSLFNACANCKNSSLALNKAETLRQKLLEDKFHKINIINYNSMLKAFGRHGDISTCLNIIDEVLEKRLKVFTYTYNFLLQACISDKNAGLRHALLIWRKMVQQRRLPDIWFFNLFLRCVRDCSLGEVTLIPQLIKKIKMESGKFYKKKEIFVKVKGETKRKIIKVPALGIEYKMRLEKYTAKVEEEKQKHRADEVKKSEIGELSETDVRGEVPQLPIENISEPQLPIENISEPQLPIEKVSEPHSAIAEEMTERDELAFSEEGKDELFSSEENIPVEESSLVESEPVENQDFEFPDLLAFMPSTGSVVDFGAMTEPHHRILLFGGVEGFLETMAKFNVKPNVLTFSLLLNVCPPTVEAEQKIIELANSHKVKLDTAFFTQLIKKRIYSDRPDLIKDSLHEMQNAGVQPDLMFFGVLAYGCDTREKGMDLLKNIKLYGYRPNSEILCGLLHKAGRAKDLVYVKDILDCAKAEDVELSPKFIAKLGRIVSLEKRQRRMALEGAREQREGQMALEEAREQREGQMALEEAREQREGQMALEEAREQREGQMALEEEARQKSKH